MAEPFAEIDVRPVMIERFGTDAFGTGPAPCNTQPDRHHKLMLRIREGAVLEGGVEVLESVRSRCRWIHRAKKGVSRAERDREILGDPFRKLRRNIALAHWRIVASLETIDGRQRHLIIDAGIIDTKRCRKEAIADDFVGEAFTKGNKHYGEPWQARAQKTDRHQNSPQVEA